MSGSAFHLRDPRRCLYGPKIPSFDPSLIVLSASALRSQNTHSLLSPLTLCLPALTGMKPAFALSSQCLQCSPCLHILSLLQAQVQLLTTNPQNSFKMLDFLDPVVHACNSSTQRAEVGGTKFQVSPIYSDLVAGYPGLQQSKALSHKNKPCPTLQNKTQAPYLM